MAESFTGSVLGDQILAGGGIETLFDGSNNDRLIGGTGLDRLFGGRGIDAFVIEVGPGLDTVKDFEGAIDRIDLSAYSYATLAIARSRFTDVGASLVFTDGTDQMVIENWQRAQIGQGGLII